MGVPKGVTGADFGSRLQSRQTPKYAAVVVLQGKAWEGTAEAGCPVQSCRHPTAAESRRRRSASANRQCRGAP